MKNLIYFSFIIILIFSCKKNFDPNDNVKLYDVRFNGKLWKYTNARIGVNKNCNNFITLIFEIENKKGVKKESFSISQIIPKEGIYYFNKPIYDMPCGNNPKTIINVNYFLIDDDSVNDSYNVLIGPKEINELTIDKYDSTGKKYISGNFNATLLIRRNPDGTKQNINSIDTIRITNAKFEAKGF